jgi:hypothetical protein
MNEQAKNKFLLECYSNLKDIIKRLDKVSKESGTEDYVSVHHDFKRLKADFQESSAYYDQQDKDLGDFSRNLEKIESVFNKADSLILPLI